MPPISIRTWESFEKELKEVRHAESSAGRKADFLYRGLRDSTLPLATTLERAGHGEMNVIDYYRIIPGQSPPWKRSPD
jgi:hypothetical protein